MHRGKESWTQEKVHEVYFLSDERLVRVSWKTRRSTKKAFPVQKRRTNGVMAENKSFVVLLETPAGGERKVRIRATTPKEAANLAKKKVKDSKVKSVFKVEKAWSHAWNDWESGKPVFR